MSIKRPIGELERRTELDKLNNAIATALETMGQEWALKSKHVKLFHQEYPQVFATHLAKTGYPHKIATSESPQGFCGIMADTPIGPISFEIDHKRFVKGVAYTRYQLKQPR